jgi:hypothetical protein
MTGLYQFFQDYRSHRQEFVKTCFENADKPEHAGELRAERTLSLLLPSLVDPDTELRQVATLAIGRLCKGKSEEAKDAARQVCETRWALARLIDTLEWGSSVDRKTALVTLRNIVQQDRANALDTVGETHVGRSHSNLLTNLILCIEDTDTGVQDKALWLLGDLASWPIAGLEESGLIAVVQTVYCAAGSEMTSSFAGGTAALRAVALNALYMVAKNGGPLLVYKPGSTQSTPWDGTRNLVKQLAKDLRNDNEQVQALAAALLGVAAQTEELAGIVSDSDQSMIEERAYEALVDALRVPRACYHAAKALSSAIAGGRPAAADDSPRPKEVSDFIEDLLVKKPGVLDELVEVVKQSVPARAYAMLALEGIAEDQDRAMRVLQASHSTGALALCNALRDSDVSIQGCAAAAVARCASWGPGLAVETLLKRGALRQLVKLPGSEPSKEHVDRAIGYLIRNARAASATDPEPFFYAMELADVLKLSPGLAKDILDQIVNILANSPTEKTEFARKGLGIINDLLPSINTKSTNTQLQSIMKIFEGGTIPTVPVPEPGVNPDEPTEPGVPR